MRKKFTKFSLMFVILIAVFGLIGCAVANDPPKNGNGNGNGYYNGNGNGNGENGNGGKIPDPGGCFSYDRVIVILTEAATAQNREWTPADFAEFEFSEVDNRFVIGGRLYLVFYLAEPSRENVLRAVYRLRVRPEVHFVSLDYNMPGD